MEKQTQFCENKWTRVSQNILEYEKSFNYEINEGRCGVIILIMATNNMEMDPKNEPILKPGV